VPAVTSLLIVGAGVAVAAFTARGEKRRRTAIMRAVAERRHGTLEPGGWFGNPLLEITHGDGIEIRVSMWSTKHGRFTEYNAIIPAPGLPVCRVAPTGFTGRVGKVLGAQDIEVGLVAFDETFVVKGDDPAVVRRLWPTARARDMALAFRTSRIECDASTIKLLQPVIESAEQIESGIDLVLGLARSDPFGLTVLGELPEAKLRHGDRFVQALLPGPSRIQIGPVEQGGIVRTCARTAAIGPLPPDAVTSVSALGATLETSDQELTISWPSVEDDPRRLTAAAELLRRLASGPSLGVFR